MLRLDRPATQLTAQVIQGTPAASPSPPPLARTPDGLWDLPLARIRVDPGATTIDQGKITLVYTFADSGWLPLGTDSPTVWEEARALRVRKAGRWVYLRGALTRQGSTLQTTDPDGSRLLTIPEGHAADLRPLHDRVRRRRDRRQDHLVAGQRADVADAVLRGHPRGPHRVDLHHLARRVANSPAPRPHPHPHLDGQWRQPEPQRLTDAAGRPAAVRRDTSHGPNQRTAQHGWQRITRHRNRPDPPAVHRRSVLGTLAAVPAALMLGSRASGGTAGAAACATTLGQPPRNGAAMPAGWPGYNYDLRQHPAHHQLADQLPQRRPG